MDELNLYALYEADKGTLSAPGRRHFLKQVQAHGQAYLPYMQRVGPGCATAASDVTEKSDSARHTDPAVPLPAAAVPPVP